MKKLILATSVIALSLSGIAQSNAQPVDTISNQDTVRGTLDRAIDTTSDKIDRMANKVEAKYNDMKVSVLGHDNKFTDYDSNSEYTAKRLIGKTVVNTNGERVGTLSDMAVDAQGNIKSVIVADGDFARIGKKAAFNFGAVVSQDADGKVVTTISENDISKAQKFENFAAGTFSLKEILDADVKTVSKALDADVENVILKGNKAQYIVFKAENDDTNRNSMAAIDLSAVKLTAEKDNDVDIRLSERQEASLLSRIATAAQ